MDCSELNSTEKTRTSKLLNEINEIYQDIRGESMQPGDQRCAFHNSRNMPLHLCFIYHTHTHIYIYISLFFSAETACGSVENTVILLKEKAERGDSRAAFLLGQLHYEEVTDALKFLSYSVSICKLRQNHVRICLLHYWQTVYWCIIFLHLSNNLVFCRAATQKQRSSLMALKMKILELCISWLSYITMALEPKKTLWGLYCYYYDISHILYVVNRSLLITFNATFKKISLSDITNFQNVCKSSSDFHYYAI